MAPECGKIFVDTVFRLHGPLDVIISDPDLKFNIKFGISLFDFIGADLQFSMAFHPQIDGLSESTMHKLKNFWRPYVERHPSERTQHLSLDEIMANNAIRMVAGYNPFYLNAREHPIVLSTFLGMQGQARRW